MRLRLSEIKQAQRVTHSTTLPHSLFFVSPVRDLHLNSESCTYLTSTAISTLIASTRVVRTYKLVQPRNPIRYARRERAMAL
jgi:hypothetical protein